MRIALYAEGPNETGMVEAPPSTARELPISDDDLGPAHVLTRRAIVHETGRDARSIRFVPPLLHRGKIATGSQLLNAKALAQLLTWTFPRKMPELAVVLVDLDGIDTRRADIEAVLAARSVSIPPAVLAIAVQEFEAWMLADVKALSAIVQRPIQPYPDLEAWEPARAKHELASQLGGVRAPSTERISRSLTRATSTPSSAPARRSAATLTTCVE